MLLVLQATFQQLLWQLTLLQNISLCYCDAVMTSNNFIKADQSQPYGDILLRPGSAPKFENSIRVSGSP